MLPAVILLVLRVIIAAVLYAFLAAIFIMLWRDMREEPSSREYAPDSYLWSANGEVERMYSLELENSLGRAADNTISLQDKTVSAHHARLFFRGGKWWLEDLGSRNGTRINGVDIDTAIELRYEDQIEFGTVNFTLKAGAVPGNADLPTPNS